MVSILRVTTLLLLCTTSGCMRWFDWGGESTPPPAAAVERNVADIVVTGAVGDGIADDTAAFEKAIALATHPGATIRVPIGKYRLTRTLTLANTNLLGLTAGGWNADSIPMPTLVVGQTSGPTLRLLSGASVHGIAIVDDIARRFTPHPPAIEVAGQVVVSSTRIQYPYDGIVFSAQSENGRSNIADVFIVSPGHDGVVVTGAHDIPTLRNIEVWCNVGFSRGAGFRFRQNDELHGSRLFAFQCKTGFVFEDEPVVAARRERAGTYGTLVDCTTDACERGWNVSGWARLNIVGGDFWNHQAGIVIDSSDADVKIVGADLQSNGEPAVRAVRVGSLVISGCTLRGAANTVAAFAQIDAARSLAVSGNIFGAGRPGVGIGEDVLTGSISGNAFESPPGQAFSIDGASPGRIAISGNSGGR